MNRIGSIAVLLVTVVLGILACNDKVETPLREGGGLEVRIHMDCDTIYFLPGDSARCNGWVVVKDASGNPMPNIRVSVSLERPFGFLEFVDAQKHDTTDATGRVYFRFLTFNQAGENTIIASIANIRDTWPLVVRQSPLPAVCTEVTITPDTLFVSGTAEDSVLMEIWVVTADTPHVGIRGYPVGISATGGRLRGLPPTDSTGYTSTHWYSNWQGQGGFCFSVSPRSCDGDTVCVVVMDTTSGGR
jgi:hypothetical protein